MFNSIDDDDFFVPTSSNNLAMLFSSSISSAINLDASLTYTAPKQIKPATVEDHLPKTKLEKPKEQNSVLSAKPVNLYKLDDSHYVLLGKYGLALIGSAVQADEIILYKDKQNILKRVKTTPDFEFIVQNEKYLCFSDDLKQYYSMNFESVKDLNEFVCSIKSKNIKVLNKKIYETEAEPRISDNADESPNSQTRADILSRMAKMGQSMIPNPVLKNKLLSDSETDDGSDSNKLILNRKPKTKKDVPGAAVNVKEKHNSTNTGKAVPTISPNLQLAPTSSVSYATPNITHTLPNNVIMTSLPPAIDTLNLNMYISENRMHNSEIRMNMSMMSSKMDNMLAEISKLKFPSDTDKLENDFLKAKINTLETKLAYLMKTLEEKECAKSNDVTGLIDEIKVKDEIICQKNDEITELEKQLLEMKSVTERLKNNEEELKKIIDVKQLRINELEAFYEENKNVGDLQATIDKLRDDIGDLNAVINELEEIKDNREMANMKSFSENVKHSMNSMYQNILKNLSEVGPSSNVQSILASNMKQTTYEIIQHFRKCMEDKGFLKEDHPPTVPEF